MAPRLAGGGVLVGGLVNAAVGVLGLAFPDAFMALIGHADETLTGAGRVFAAYAGSRDLAVGLALLVLLLRGSTGPLAAMVLAASLANALDALAAAAAERWVQVPGAALFAAGYLAAGLWLLRRAGRLEPA